MQIPTKMIDKNKVTFILGAGSSAEIGMPIGSSLKEQIELCLDFTVSDGMITGGNALVRDAIIHLANSSKVEGVALIHAARLISRSMPQALSIDNFINSHRSNPNVAIVGKLAIAACILEAERASKIYTKPERDSKLVVKNASETWYNALFQKITQYRQVDEIPKALSGVRIITFNYDRTLEFFLSKSLQNFYGISHAESIEILTNLKIYHPYGTVGALWPSENNSIIAFGKNPSPLELIASSKDLRTFTEEVAQGAATLEAFRACIWGASNIICLGYAFHELNNKLLFGAPRVKDVRYETRLIGTAYNESPSNLEAIAGEVMALGKLDRANVTIRRDLMATQLMSEYSRSYDI
jgi:hypothetical protein